jgi:GNAT superfamily N-acetyltransferase
MRDVRNNPDNVSAFMWRTAAHLDDPDIVEMSRHLYAEDPSPAPVPESHTLETLSILRAEPVRGRAVVLQVNDLIVGYALLISFWSNELGGEVLVIDELYVRPPYRNRGHGRALFAILARENQLWPRQPAALEIEVTPRNERAAALYLNLGFKAIKNSRMRLVPPRPRA